MADTLSDATTPIMVDDNSETPSTANIESPTPSSSQQSQCKKPPVNQSIVWSHFKKVEPIDKENPKAMCNYCNRLIGCHYKRNGTSAMMLHLTYNCPDSPLKKSKDSRLPKNQTMLQMSFKKPVEGGSGNQIGFMKYDSNNIRNLIVRYFIKSELPFRHVESDGFRELINGIEPRFKVPCRITLQKDCLKLYEEEKLRLRTFLSGKRVCITTDTWTSLQNINYMCVTASFIDSDWTIHKKILKFNQIPNHRGETIGRMIESALTQWGIDSVFTITVDNASANDVGIEYMRKRMKNKSDTVLGGDFLHMRCAAHILNLVVHEGLKDLGDCVTNIRNAVRYVRSSPERMSKFKECIEREKIKCKNMVCLDVPTRWNSTYLMLTTAEKYQRAFDLLGEDEHNHFVVPQPIDWENARAFATFLQTFYEATLKFSGSTHVTSNSYFLQLCIIQNTLNDGCLSEDEVLSSVSFSMKQKYEKYWGTMDMINLMLYVGFVLDPRNKMKALVFWLKKCNGPMWADQIEAKVRDLLNRLIEQYNKFHGRGVGESSNIVEDTRRVDVNPICGDGDKETQYRNMFSQHLVAENDLECRSDVDQYLLDGCEANIIDFDILNWWKVNTPKYPTLAAIARDVLAIPISTVASESAFSNGGRVLDTFRSSLSPLTVEALICTQDWLKNRPMIYEEVFQDFMESYDEPGKFL